MFKAKKLLSFRLSRRLMLLSAKSKKTKMTPRRRTSQSSTHDLALRIAPWTPPTRRLSLVWASVFLRLRIWRIVSNLK